jgi:hypothetical protein
MITIGHDAGRPTLGGSLPDDCDQGIGFNATSIPREVTVSSPGW